MLVTTMLKWVHECRRTIRQECRRLLCSFAWSEDIHGQRDRASLVRLKSADTHDLACHFFATVIANRDDDGVLPSVARFGMTKIALDSER